MINEQFSLTQQVHMQQTINMIKLNHRQLYLCFSSFYLRYQCYFF